MTVNLDILTREFPKQAVKQRVIGGGRRVDYIDGTTVIRRLNEATGNNWSFRVDRYWTEGDLSLALVTIEIPGHGSRQHIGVQKMQTNAGEDLVKGAITDALKKAATLFGVALELYGPDYEAGELDHPLGTDVRGHEPAAPAGAREQPYRSGGGVPATERQIKAIFSIGHQHGWTDGEIRDEMINRWQKEHTNQLTVAEASELIDVLKGRAVPGQLPV